MTFLNGLLDPGLLLGSLKLLSGLDGVKFVRCLLLLAPMTVERTVAMLKLPPPEHGVH